MYIRISNWTLYNPRTDVKKPSWFRLEHDWLTDHEFFDLTSDQKLVWIAILSEASRKQSSVVKISQTMISAIVRTTPDVVDQTVTYLADKNIIERVSDVDVTSALRARNECVRKRTATRRDETRRNNNTKSSSTWLDSEPLAKVFANLSAIPKYRAIFDVKKDRGTIEAHMERLGLSLAEMEQVTWDYRCWADGPNAEKIKSPRGTLSTFVRGFAERRSKAPPAQQPKEKTPVITSAEDFDALTRA
jgi:hypothetical protein